MEKRSDYPGVTAGLEAVREYPGPVRRQRRAPARLPRPGERRTSSRRRRPRARRASSLPHESTCCAAPTSSAAPGSRRSTTRALRGTPGVKQLRGRPGRRRRGHRGRDRRPSPATTSSRTSTRACSPSSRSSSLAAIERAPRHRDRTGPGKYKADSGAAVVLDVTNGHVLAMASYPSLRPRRCGSAASRSKEYTALTAKTSNYPLHLARDPGPVRAGVDVQDRVGVRGAAERLHGGRRPTSARAYLQVGNRKFSNFEGEAPGDVDLAKGLAVSCDTMWYEHRLRRSGCKRRRATRPWPSPRTRSRRWPRPSATASAPASTCRASRAAASADARSRRRSTSSCTTPGASARSTGYPEVAKTDPTRAIYLKALAKENCADGGVYRGGDAVNLVHRPGRHRRHAAAGGAGLRRGRQRRHALAAAGGQGHRRAASGKVVSLIKPKVTGKLPVSKAQPRVPARTRSPRSPASPTAPATTPFTRLPARPDPGRGQDRNRPGVATARPVDVVVRDLRAGQQAEVRRRHDGVAGRHRRRHERPERAQDLRGHLRRHGLARSTRRSRCSSAARPPRSCRRSASRRHAGLPGDARPARPPTPRRRRPRPGSTGPPRPRPATPRTSASDAARRASCSRAAARAPRRAGRRLTGASQRARRAAWSP